MTPRRTSRTPRSTSSPISSRPIWRRSSPSGSTRLGRRPRDTPRSSRRRCPRPTRGSSAARDELAAVSALLDDDATRLVTLLGPGGVGKSRLAIEIASATTAGFPDGAAFIAARERDRARTADSEHRLRPRHPRHRRAVARGAPGGGSGRSAHADRPRQLRAARRGGAHPRASVLPRTDRHVPGDQPRGAAHPRRAGLRGAAPPELRPDLARLPDAGGRLPRRAAVRRARAGPCGRTSS